MFGCCVAGRLLQTNLQQVDETRAYFELPAASSINHICVFLLGTIPFPEGYGCTVHFFWPGKGFQVLGMLSNEKPSAIFRLRGTFTAQSASSSHSAFSDAAGGAPDAAAQVTAILGLAIEPLADIAAQMSSMSGAVARPEPTRDPTVLAERIVKHLFNYVSGFTGGNAVSPDVPVPMGLIVKWYESFMAKVKNGGIGFLDRTE
ncbi:unnamed protein product [Mycena citricolor]|uniref:Hikeshi-like domain-containing protein n=1 Tax=Mycena citricolor TaxID=2018698 RepID=A0AAD2GTQ8_9AGAR|nr:unnamed protein product [Mycena citricolor]CAK5278456.1 unnamed protein product [Mycena citricolor]